MQFKTQVLDSIDVNRSITRIAHEIIEKNSGTDEVALVGILTRGVPLAERIADKLFLFENVEVPIGKLDITLYRDDLSELPDAPHVNATEIKFDVAGKKIILIDDVIYTGRTIRAALDAIIALGRPASVQLAVLVDRGHRELPIRPDYTGKNLPTSQSEVVKVSLTETDGQTNVSIYTK